jgi:hypothetical protein
MRKRAQGSPPSAADPSPPNPTPPKTQLKPDLELLARFELLWWKAFTWGQKEELAGVKDRKAFWDGKTIDQAEQDLRSLILQRVLLGEIELPKLYDANRDAFHRLAERRHADLLRKKKGVQLG